MCFITSRFKNLVFDHKIIHSAWSHLRKKQNFISVRSIIYYHHVFLTGFFQDKKCVILGVLRILWVLVHAFMVNSHQNTNYPSFLSLITRRDCRCRLWYHNTVAVGTSIRVRRCSWIYLVFGGSKRNLSLLLIYTIRRYYPKY